MKLPRTSRVLLTLLLPLLLAAPRPAAQADEEDARPNVLLLFADDQRADTIGAWGNPHIKTPRIDSLVQAGYGFRRAYCLGSPHGAVCMPSRAMLHTGHAYIGMDLGTFDGRPTLGQLLGEAGYETHAVGKWHNGKASLARSFQHGRTVMLGGMSNHYSVPLVDLDDGEFKNKRKGEGHSTQLFAQAAVDYLATRKGKPEPFFLYVAFTAPHDPRDPPLPWREGRERPPLPKNFRGQHGFQNGQLTVRDEKLAPWPRPAGVIREQLAEYYGLIEHLDSQVGRVLDALEASGHADDTIVVYAADHGLALGSHGLVGKQSVYEHSLGAPLIILGPGIPQGQSSEALVYLHDLFPTLCALTGVDGPDSPSSSDLAPLWQGERQQLRDTLFLSMYVTQRAVTDGRWKLIRYPVVDHTQLFDLSADPHELNDLADEAAHGERIASLRKELEAWQLLLGDAEVTWTHPNPEPLEIDLTGHPREPDRWQPEWIRRKYFGE